jgi:hypothetical protein
MRLTEGFIASKLEEAVATLKKELSAHGRMASTSSPTSTTSPAKAKEQSPLKRTASSDSGSSAASPTKSAAKAISFPSPSRSLAPVNVNLYDIQHEGTTVALALRSITGTSISYPVSQTYGHMKRPGMGPNLKKHFGLDFIGAMTDVVILAMILHIVLSLIGLNQANCGHYLYVFFLFLQLPLYLFFPQLTTFAFYQNRR